MRPWAKIRPTYKSNRSRQLRVSIIIYHKRTPLTDLHQLKLLTVVSSSLLSSTRPTQGPEIYNPSSNWNTGFKNGLKWGHLACCFYFLSNRLSTSYSGARCLAWLLVLPTVGNHRVSRVALENMKPRALLSSPMPDFCSWRCEQRSAPVPGWTILKNWKEASGAHL